MDGCGHDCCPIPGNPCHVHPEPPHRCALCAAAGAMGAAGGAAVIDGIGASLRDDVERTSRDLSRITATVMSRFAPEIPGLPPGTDLEALVGPLVMVAYFEAIGDPVLTGVCPAELRTVVAGRVAVDLAFPGHL